MALVITEEDPHSGDVRALVEIHLRFSYEGTPAGYAFVLPVEGLVDPLVTLFGARRDGVLVGMAALRRLDAGHVEIKSMHVREAERGQGVGRALVDHLLSEARRSGYRRVSLETGTMESYAAARALYERTGFRPAPPFGEYEPSPYNTFMSLALDAD